MLGLVPVVLGHWKICCKTSSKILD